MPYFAILLIVVFAVFFYRAAEFEDESSLIWCGLSILISVATLFFLHWGWLGTILGQVGLFVGIGIFRVMRKS
ncbi:MAG: hypothetical protein ABSE97_00610 [Verrucomicrobiota bacterium]|jgi:hypothetical protein